MYDQESKLAKTLAAIVPTSPKVREDSVAYHDNLTKPPRSLGRLETIGVQLCTIAGQCPPPVPNRPLVAVFGADHGCAPKTSPWPQAVTTQMAVNIVNGGAGVSVLTRHCGGQILLTDVGILAPLDLAESDSFWSRRIRPGSADLTEGPAMTVSEAVKALEIGIEVAQWGADNGFNAIVPGEIGIGNTSPASLLIAALTGKDILEVAGRGSDPTGNKLDAKRKALLKAVEVNRAALQSDPIEVLAAVGGLEIAAMAGAMIGGAANQLPVVVDGVIASAAALVAVKLNPDILGYLIAGHNGAEPGIKAADEVLQLEPVLDLGMWLGEGSGAATAMPIIQAAAVVMHQMATFESAGVTSEHE